MGVLLCPGLGVELGAASGLGCFPPNPLHRPHSLCACRGWGKALGKGGSSFCGSCICLGNQRLFHDEGIAANTSLHPHPAPLVSITTPTTLRTRVERGTFSLSHAT